VAVGDVDGDGRSEIMTVPGNGAGSQVQVFDGQNFKETASFLAYPSNFTGGAFIAAASVKQPRLAIQADRENAGMIQLQWQAGCVCELQVNLDATSREGWTALDVRPVENGNRLGLLLPAVQKFQSFRLKLRHRSASAKAAAEGARLMATLSRNTAPGKTPHSTSGSKRNLRLTTQERSIDQAHHH
jgi:hypothetical protein